MTGSEPTSSKPTSSTPLLDAEPLLLVYDKDCPLCNNFSQMVRIKDTVGQLQLVNARDDSPIMQEITEAGLNIDNGMVLKMGGQIYYGSEAVHALSLISSRSGVFNRLNYWAFKSEKISKVLYPMMVAGRALLLKLLRKSKINNLDIDGDDRF